MRLPWASTPRPVRQTAGTPPSVIPQAEAFAVAGVGSAPETSIPRFCLAMITPAEGVLPPLQGMTSTVPLAYCTTVARPLTMGK